MSPKSYHNLSQIAEWYTLAKKNVEYNLGYHTDVTSSEDQLRDNAYVFAFDALQTAKVEASTARRIAQEVAQAFIANR